MGNVVIFILEILGETKISNLSINKSHSFTVCSTKTITYTYTCTHALMHTNTHMLYTYTHTHTDIYIMYNITEYVCVSTVT